MGTSVRALQTALQVEYRKVGTEEDQTAVWTRIGQLIGELRGLNAAIEREYLDRWNEHGNGPTPKPPEDTFPDL